MTIPVQFASLYDRQEVFVWSNCLLDLGTDYLVGNMFSCYSKLHMFQYYTRAPTSLLILPPQHWRMPVVLFSCYQKGTHSLVTPIFLYACESWTLTEELQRRIQAMEMRCYHKILRISYKDHAINEEACAKI